MSQRSQLTLVSFSLCAGLTKFPFGKGKKKEKREEKETSSFNKYPFRCRSTRGRFRHSSAIDRPHLSNGEAVYVGGDQYQHPDENHVMAVCCVCCVCREKPQPIICIHHQTPVVVWSPVNATVFTQFA